MFDIGWSEMAVVLLVALIVIGPKDLPRLARTMGQWAAKGRAMAREFQRALEDMAREAELDKVKSEIEKAGRTDVGRTIEKTIDPSGELRTALDPNIGIGTASSRGRAAGEQPASAAAQPEQPASVPVTPAASGPVASASPESGATNNGAGVAQARKEPGPDNAAAATAKRERHASAGNGAGAADDTNEPAHETARAEPN